MMKYKLFIPSYETIEDAFEIDAYFEDEAVEKYCEHIYHENDGWDWMKNDGCKTKICSVDESGKMTYYCFELEYIPSFFVAEVEA